MMAMTMTIDDDDDDKQFDFQTLALVGRFKFFSTIYSEKC
jgi:hypothetical protein